jgi:hypothetical protein
METPRMQVFGNIFVHYRLVAVVIMCLVHLGTDPVLPLPAQLVGAHIVTEGPQQDKLIGKLLVSLPRIYGLGHPPFFSIS